LFEEFWVIYKASYGKRNDSWTQVQALVLTATFFLTIKYRTSLLRSD